MPATLELDFTPPRPPPLADEVAPMFRFPEVALMS